MSSRNNSAQNKLTRKTSSATAPDLHVPAKDCEDVDTNTKKMIEKMLNNQEDLLIVYQVREELMENVMQKCYEKDIERKTVSFVVKCAHKAIMQIIDLNFYAHDPGIDNFQTHPDWRPDSPPEPSSPDTWAAYNVPVTTDLVSKEEEKSEVPRVSLDVSEPTITEVPSVLTDYSEPCSLISEPVMSHSASDYSECLLAPNVSEVLTMESTIEEVSTTEDVKKEKSLFTKIATVLTDIYPSKMCSDYKSRETVKLPKIPKIIDDKKKGMEMKISLSGLPPMRADTILQRSSSPVKGEKKKTDSSLIMKNLVL